MGSFIVLEFIMLSRRGLQQMSRYMLAEGAERRATNLTQVCRGFELTVKIHIESHVTHGDSSQIIETKLGKYIQHIPCRHGGEG